MGFGSYDESEQENQEVETEESQAESKSEEADHNGDVTFELGDTEEAIERLKNISEEENEEQ